MAQAVFSSPIRKVYGETVALTTTAAHLGVMPGYHEVMLYCASAWRLGLAPRLARVKLYTGSAYIDYTAEATDRLAATHVPLDAMPVTKKLYLGFTDPVRGWYEIIDDTNKNAVNTTRDVEYLYDVSGPGYQTLTGTVSAALTVGETITGSVSGATGVAVYDNGSTYLVVKTVTGQFAIGENAAGATQACNTLTNISPTVVGTGYFTDVASDSDGTDSTGTLAQDGLYSFTLPSVVRGALAGIDNESLYWYRWTPGNTLSATIDVTDIYPACPTVTYAYMEGGMVYQFSLNTDKVGAFEFDHTATGTLDVTWIQH